MLIDSRDVIPQVHLLRSLHRLHEASECRDQRRELHPPGVGNKQRGVARVRHATRRVGRANSTERMRQGARGMLRERFHQLHAEVGGGVLRVGLHGWVAGQLLQQRERHAELRETGVCLQLGGWNLLRFPFAALDLDAPYILHPLPDLLLQNALLFLRDPPGESARLPRLCIRSLLLQGQDARTEVYDRTTGVDRTTVELSRAFQATLERPSMLGYARCSGPIVHIRVRIRGVLGSSSDG